MTDRHGDSVTCGVGPAVHPDDLPGIFGVWWEPSYVDLVVNGWLANPVKPWGMSRVLTEEWPPDVVA